MELVSCCSGMVYVVQCGRWSMKKWKQLLRGAESVVVVMSLGVTLRPGLVHDLTNEEHRRLCIGINTLTFFWNDPFLPLELRKREPLEHATA